MIVRALRSFAGVVSMVPGQVRNIEASIAQDLIRAGHVELVAQKYVAKETPAPKKQTGKKKKK